MTVSQAYKRLRSEDASIASSWLLSPCGRHPQSSWHYCILDQPGTKRAEPTVHPLGAAICEGISSVVSRLHHADAKLFVEPDQIQVDAKRRRSLKMVKDSQLALTLGRPYVISGADQ